MDPIVGIDLSVHNWRRGVPFGMLGRLHGMGVRFLFARASIGTEVDPSFDANRHRGTFRSWVPGGYHYLVDSVPGDRQAATFVGEIQRTGGIEGLVTSLDVEDDNQPPIRNHVSMRQVEAFVRTFKDAHPKHRLGLYANRSTWNRLGNPDFEDVGFDFVWNALWPRGVNTPADLPGKPPLSFGGAGRAPLWQWGSLEVRSFTGGNILHLDGDAWYGTLDELRALGTQIATPIQDRPAYRDAFNATLALALDAIGGVTPASGGPAVVAGSKDALEAAIQAVQDEKLGRKG